jgi:hypothetical protein
MSISDNDSITGESAVTSSTVTGDTETVLWEQISPRLRLMKRDAFRL